MPLCYASPLHQRHKIAPHLHPTSPCRNAPEACPTIVSHLNVIVQHCHREEGALGACRRRASTREASPSLLEMLQWNAPAPQLATRVVTSGRYVGSLRRTQSVHSSVATRSIATRAAVAPLRETSRERSMVRRGRVEWREKTSIRTQSFGSVTRQ